MSSSTCTSRVETFQTRSDFMWKMNWSNQRLSGYSEFNIYIYLPWYSNQIDWLMAPIQYNSPGISLEMLIFCIWTSPVLFEPNKIQLFEACSHEYLLSNTERMSLTLLKSDCTVWKQLHSIIHVHVFWILTWTQFQKLFYTISNSNMRYVFLK